MPNIFDQIHAQRTAPPEIPADMLEIDPSMLEVESAPSKTKSPETPRLATTQQLGSRERTEGELDRIARGSFVGRPAPSRDMSVLPSMATQSREKVVQNFLASQPEVLPKEVQTEVPPVPSVDVKPVEPSTIPEMEGFSSSQSKARTGAQLDALQKPVSGAHDSDFQHPLLMESLTKESSQANIEKLLKSEVSPYKPEAFLPATTLNDPPPMATLDSPKTTPSPTGRQAVVDLATKTLTVYEGGKAIRKFNVLVGSSKFPTPSGQFRILNKIIPSGEESYLGSRWMSYHQTDDADFGMHGITPEQEGYKKFTHGCVALGNDDAKELYGLMSVGDPVIIKAPIPGLEKLGGVPPPVPVQPPVKMLQYDDTTQTDEEGVERKRAIDSARDSILQWAKRGTTLKRPLPTELQSREQQLAEAPVFRNPRTGQVTKRGSDTGTGPLGVLDAPVIGAGEVAQGVEQMAAPAEALALGKATDATMREGAAGLHKAVGGAFKAASPLVVATGIAAPVPTALTLAAGMTAQAGVESGLQALGLPKEYAEVAGDLAAVIASGKALTAIKRAALKARIQPILQARLNAEYANRQAAERAGQAPTVRPQIEAPKPAPSAERPIVEGDFEDIPAPGQRQLPAPMEVKPADLEVVNAEPVETPAPAKPEPQQAALPPSPTELPARQVAAPTAPAAPVLPVLDVHPDQIEVVPTATGAPREPNAPTQRTEPEASGVAPAGAVEPAEPSKPAAIPTVPARIEIQLAPAIKSLIGYSEELKRVEQNATERATRNYTPSARQQFIDSAINLHLDAIRPHVEESLGKIREFRKMAQKNGVDADAWLKSKGVPDEAEFSSRTTPEPVEPTATVEQVQEERTSSPEPALLPSEPNAGKPARKLPEKVELSPREAELESEYQFGRDGGRWFVVPKGEAPSIHNAVGIPIPVSDALRASYGPGVPVPAYTDGKFFPSKTELRKALQAYHRAVIERENAEPVPAGKPAIAAGVAPANDSGLTPEQNSALMARAKIHNELSRVKTAIANVGTLRPKDVASEHVKLGQQKQALESELAEAQKRVDAAFAQPSPTSASAAPKQPWEMTRSQFANAHFATGLATGIGKLPAVREYYDLLKGTADPTFGRNAERALPEALTKAKAAVDAEFGPGAGDIYFDSHGDQVKRALAAGKPVPQEVLADYPDLQPISSSPATEAVTPPQPAAASTAMEANRGGEGEASAERYDDLYRQIQAAQKDPRYRADTHEGSQFRDGVRDLEAELERHKSAAVAKAQAEIDAEAARKAQKPAQPTEPEKSAPNRLTANAADLAADYKARGMDRTRAWDQFVIDRNLKPGMDAGDFYRVFDSVTPARFSANAETPVVTEIAPAEQFEVSGPTYPYKTRLRSLGGEWDAERKVWTIPADKVDAVRRISPKLVIIPAKAEKPASGVQNVSPRDTIREKSAQKPKPTVSQLANIGSRENPIEDGSSPLEAYRENGQWWVRSTSTKATPAETEWRKATAEESADLSGNHHAGLILEKNSPLTKRYREKTGYKVTPRASDAAHFILEENGITDDASQRLLEMATRRVALKHSELEDIMQMARAIQRLDIGAPFKAKHLAEAVQYRSLPALRQLAAGNQMVEYGDPDSGYESIPDREFKGELIEKGGANHPTAKRAAAVLNEMGEAPTPAADGSAKKVPVASRTTPAPGTVERTALDEATDAADKKHGQLVEKRVQLEREHASAKFGSKKRETLDAKISKLRDQEHAAWNEYDQFRKQHYRARLEDAVAQNENTPLREAAQYELTQQDWPKGKSYDELQRRYKTATEAVRAGVRLMADELVPDERDQWYIERLTPEENKSAIDEAVGGVAQEVMQHPLTAESEGIKKRIAGSIYGRRMDIVREKALKELGDLEERGKVEGGMLASGHYERLRKRISEAYDPQSIDEALKDAREYVNTLVEQERVRRESAAKASRELSESVRPLSEAENPAINAKGLWGGNVVVGGANFVSDGHMLIDKTAIQNKKRAAALSLRKGVAEQSYPEAKIKSAFDKMTSEAKSELKEIGHASINHANLAFYDDESGTLYAVPTQQVKLIHSLTGFDSVKGSKPEKPLVFYRGGKPVAAISPQKYSGPEIDPMIARESASKPKSGPTPE